jgi:UDP:flavonoid glycosyltransferase YjiC (YdhE family)
VFRTAIDGLATRPENVLVAVGPGDPAALGPVPRTVRIERFVPQAEVLRHADLVVHHGGSGTVLGAAANGLPQLLLPQGADQYVNAEALDAQGSGRSLLGADVTPEAVAAAAAVLLTEPSYRQAAQALRAEIAAMPAPADVLPALANFAGVPA